MKICPACRREYGDAERTCSVDGVSLVVLESQSPGGGELIGQVVQGRYRIERIVGRGGMGTVYACRHVVVGKEFAIKVLRDGIERSEEVLQRFIREAQAANAVRSRHICETLDFGQLPNGALYVVMELLDGVSLTRVLREQEVSRTTLKHIFVQVAETLQKAHDLQIVHRDLKPDNVVLVNDDGDRFFVKLVDFGIAKVMQKDVSDLTETGVILGTPYYMSPEQARGEVIDHRSDIYALGVMMYRAFTGKLPFVADTAMGVLTRHLTEKPRLPSELREMDLGTERLILRCLEKRAIDRFQSMSDVADAIRSLPDEEGRSGASSERMRRATPTRLDTPVMRRHDSAPRLGIDPSRSAMPTPRMSEPHPDAEPNRVRHQSSPEPRVSYASHPPGVFTASGNYPGPVLGASGGYPGAVLTASGNYEIAGVMQPGAHPGGVLTSSGNYPSASAPPPSVFTASGAHPSAPLSGAYPLSTASGSFGSLPQSYAGGARPPSDGAFGGADSLPPHLRGESHTARGVVSTRLPAFAPRARLRMGVAASAFLLLGAGIAGIMWLGMTSDRPTDSPSSPDAASSFDPRDRPAPISATTIGEPSAVTVPTPPALASSTSSADSDPPAPPPRAPLGSAQLPVPPTAPPNRLPPPPTQSRVPPPVPPHESPPQGGGDIRSPFGD